MTVSILFAFQDKYTEMLIHCVEHNGAYKTSESVHLYSLGGSTDGICISKFDSCALYLLLPGGCYVILHSGYVCLIVVVGSEWNMLAMAAVHIRWKSLWIMHVIIMSVEYDNGLESEPKSYVLWVFAE